MKRSPVLKILIVLFIVGYLLVLIAPFAFAAGAGGWTPVQEDAHLIAELARGLGLAEDDPIIVRAKELWHEENIARYTDEDAVMLAKVLWAECRGIPSTTEKACVVWDVLNRVDAGYGSIAEVVTAANQFAYDPSYPVWDELLSISYDVLTRWQNEKRGETEVGRVLPSDYLWYHGDGVHNWFRNAYTSRVYWDYSLTSPYID